MIYVAWFIVPVPSDAVQRALDGIYGSGTVILASVPTTDTTLFPSGFDSTKHPVLAAAGFDDDIRMSVLQIDGALLSGSIYVPYVRRPDSASETVLAAPLNDYMAGPSGDLIAALVPATVSTVVEGYPLRLGQFMPDNAAYQADSGGVLSNKVAWDVLPNPISGPGIYIEAFDMQYTSETKFRKTTPKLFKEVLNQPTVLSGAYLLGNICQRDQFYFNNDTSTMHPRAGNVTFGPAADGSTIQFTGDLQQASPDGSGRFVAVEGFSACGQNVGYNLEDCDEASQNVDRTAL